MSKVREWQEAHDAEWSVAAQREAVIRPLALLDQVTEDAVREAADLLQIDRSTVYRLISRFKRRPRASSLLPLQRGRPAKVWSLDPAHEQLLDTTIKEFYLTPQKPTYQALYLEVRRRFAEANLPVPAYLTVRRRVAALDQKQVTAAREGRKAAHDRFGPVGGSFRADAPLDVIQIDHTPVDVIVVDREQRCRVIQNVATTIFLCF